MEKQKTNTLEREYTIPLRAKFRSVPRYKKSNKAVKSVKEFLAKHMKVENRDLNKIKLDLFVNEAIWARGIRNPIHKIKVKAIKEGDIVRVTLVDIPKKMTARKNKIEKRESVPNNKEIKKEKKEEEKDKDKDGVEDKVEIKENEKANEEDSNEKQLLKAKENKKTTSKEKKKSKTQPKEKIAK